MCGGPIAVLYRLISRLDGVVQDYSVPIANVLEILHLLH